MKNSSELEKSNRGVVIFARNTETTDYVSIANQNAKLIKKHLGLPTTILTNVQEDLGNSRFDSDDKTFVSWKNSGRFEVYDNSPYQETILLDADYLVLDDSLNKLFETEFDYKLFDKNVYINDLNIKETMGSHSLPFVWATAICFRKSERTKMLFDMVAMIQKNYSYYRALYNIQQSNYRNDYAFAIAHYMLNGYAVHTGDYVQWPIHTFSGPIDSLTYKKNQIVLKSNSKGWVLPVQNLHILSKQYLQSQNCKDFVESILNA